MQYETVTYFLINFAWYFIELNIVHEEQGEWFFFETTGIAGKSFVLICPPIITPIKKRKSYMNLKFSRYMAESRHF